MQTADFRGKTIEVEELDSLTSHEPWNEYQLSNGKVLMIKTVLIAVSKAVYEKTPDGKDLYLTQTQHIIKVKT